MSKIVKKMEIEALTTTFAGVRDMVILAPGKVNSLLDFTFRKALREKKIRLMMVKNTLARKVFESAGISLKGVWEGTTLIAWGADSIKDLSEAIDGLFKEYTKKDAKFGEKLKVKTAVADGQACSLDQAMKMPTRLEAIADVIGLILSPGANLSASIIGPGGTLASQVATLAEKKPEEAAAPAS